MPCRFLLCSSIFKITCQLPTFLSVTCGGSGGISSKTVKWRDPQIEDPTMITHAVECGVWWQLGQGLVIRERIQEWPTVVNQWTWPKCWKHFWKTESAARRNGRKKGDDERRKTELERWRFAKNANDETKSYWSVRRRRGRRWVYCSHGVKRQSEAAVRKAENDKDVKVANLTENDDIEAYLTTFERLM